MSSGQQRPTTVIFFVTLAQSQFNEGFLDEAEKNAHRALSLISDEAPLSDVAKMNDLLQRIADRRAAALRP